MDSNTLAEVMGRVPGVNYGALLPGYVNAMKAANINTVNRAAMFAAQLGHESVGLRYMEEIASGAAYNGRADLGNTQPGDGPRFKGRGPIQLTGRNNYRVFTQWARDAGHTDIDFESEPHRVAEPHWGFLAASWYWTVARPDINALADRADLDGVTRRINGGLNGIVDRRQRYERALAIGQRLLDSAVPAAEPDPHTRLMDYSRDRVGQETPYNCGPASVETAIQAATGKWVAESQLAKELNTHRGGTDWIGQFPAVLNRHIPGAKYTHREMPTDPPTNAQKDQLWRDITASIDAGHPVILNIVSPPNNRPRSVAPSTQQLQYPRNGWIYHYVGVFNYAGEGASRRLWWADSGFAPFGAWISFDSTASLIPPKGYAYSTAAPTTLEKKEEDTMSEAMNKRYPGFVDPEIDGTIPDWVRHADRNSFNTLVEVRALREEIAELRNEMRGQR